MFKTFDVDRLVEVSEACGEILTQENGLDVILNQAAAELPKSLHETAYALAVEVAAVDLNVTQEEIRFLQLLREALKIDPLVVAAIERGARARLHTL